MPRFLSNLKTNKSRKSHKSLKSHKSNKSRKSYKSHKSNKSHKTRNQRKQKEITLVGGGKDMEYNKITSEVIKYPFRDELELTMTPGQILHSYNSKLIYMSDTIKSKRRMQGFKAMLRRSFLDESKFLKMYEANDNGVLRIYHDSNERVYDQNYYGFDSDMLNIYEMFDVKLDQKYKSLLVRKDDAIMISTGNTSLKVDTSLKGLVTKAKTIMPRLDLEDGDTGRIWLTAPPYETVEIPDGKSLHVNPESFIACKMTNKKSYSIKTKLGVTKFNRALLSFQGPAILYMCKPDFSDTVRKYKYRLKTPI